MLKNISTYSLPIILLVSLLVRLYNLDYPLSYIFAWGDGTRDYFVANHIIKYGEVPFIGPYNLLNEIGVYNSPIYFYVLALFLIPFNHVLTLGVVNIIFQIVMIFLIYLIARKLFDQKAAILSVLLFSFNPEILAQSDYMWQPHLSAPFAYLSLLLAVYGKFLGSALCLAFSFGLHNSSVPWVPVFLIGYRKYPLALGAFFLTLAILYIPVWLYLNQNPVTTSVAHSLATQNLYQYGLNMQTYFSGFLKAFNMDFAWVIFISTLTLFYFLKGKDKNKKQVLMLLVLLIVPFIFAAFFNKYRLHYLTLSLGVFTIFLGKIFTSFPRFRVLSLIAIFLFFKSVTFDFRFLEFEKSPLQNQKLVNDLTSAIIEETKSPSNFQIKSYSMDEKIFEYPTLDTIFLIPLEEKLNKKLAVLDDKSPFNHHQVGGKDYFIVACHDFLFLSRWDKCLNTFTEGYPGYAILKNLYTGDSFSLFLAKNEN